MVLDPELLGGQGLTTGAKGSQLGTTKGRKVGPPESFSVGLDVRGAADARAAEEMEVDRLGINAADGAIWRNE